MGIKKEFSYKVYYKDTDAGGVLYYGAYLNFLEKARTDFFEQCGVSSKSFHTQGIFFAVKKVEGNYLKPVFYGDSIIVKLSVTNLKRTNLTIKYEIFNGEEVVFIGTTLLVSVNSELKVCKIPDRLKSFIKEFQKNG